MLYFTYGIMTAAVALISAFCIFLVLGYRVDLKNGDVEQGALLQYRSFPAGATINLDGAALSFVTPGKQGIDVGRHTVRYNLAGFEPWEKTVTVKASELRWLNYARLVPSDLKTTSLREFPTVVGQLPSPDRKWIMLQAADSKPEFTIADLRTEDDVKFTTLALPAGTYTAPAAGQTSKFELVEWDFGARYVLVKHTIGTTIEYLRVDRTEPAAVVNLSQKLGVTPEDIHFSGTSGTVFYALDDGAIRRLDSGAGTLSQPIVSDVASFRLYKTTSLAYVKKPVDNQVSVGVVINNKAVRLKSYDASLPVSVDLNEYFNDFYLAVGRGTSVEVYKNPESDDRSRIATVGSNASISWLRFGNNGRFIVAGTGTQFTTYDIETDEKFEVNLPGTPADPAKPLQWLDDYYLVSTADNDLRMTEFDGTNQHVLTTSLAGQPVTLSSTGEYVFSLTRTQGGVYALQATAMTREQ